MRQAITMYHETGETQSTKGKVPYKIIKEHENEKEMVK